MTCILPGGIGQLRASLAGSAWDPAHLLAMTLSNNNKTATGNNSQQGQVRGVKSQNAGKYYFEVTVNNGIGNVAGVGVTSASFSMVLGGAFGVDSNGYSIALLFNTSGAAQVWYQAAGGASASPVAVGGIVGVAVDNVTGPNPGVAFSINGVWPFGLPPGGLNPMSALALGTALFPAFCGANGPPADQDTLNTVAFTYAPPSGYTAWG